MKFFEQLKLGGKALALAQAVRRALVKIDSAALLRAIAQVLIYEVQDPTPGKGVKKWDLLADWFSDTFPQYAEWIDLLSEVVTAAVDIFKAVQIFRGRQ
jgi:hypothetical protein